MELEKDGRKKIQRTGITVQTGHDGALGLGERVL